MEIVIISVLGWLITQFVTRFSMKTKISQTLVSLAIPVILGVIYYVLRQYIIDEATRQEIVWFVSGSYASSQVFYNFRKKQGWIK